ncbi:hypothetical protein [Paucibacter sp. KCTC 42545]|uniref:hypothetical protein n=1 Tax=Paucibacter sp. KCTC 42545 TaxID=1768242 RepID=UPI000733A9A4|nr:hypothetical protein [Paucibacter sp. KCTC 42545]ALT77938.1 hypothetical protein AT984_12870 [Paucibacter sp. KCTC 42545]
MLAAKPKCLEPVRALFELANELAQDAYRLAGDSETLPFALELDVVKRGGAASSPAVDGETRESDLSDRRTVVLRVCASSFEHRDYLMLLYLFAHECIAHGYCGVRLNVDDQYLSTNFQEGWMDEVASLLLTDALEAEYAMLPGLEAWLGRSEVIEAMNNTRRLRNSFSLRKDGDVALIEEGVAAFKAFCYCMDAARGVAPHLRPSPTTVGEAIEFSMLLNASDLPHELRGFFVRRIASLYDRGSRPLRDAALRARPELIEICKSYLSSSKKFHDVETLIRATIALPL